MYKLVLIGPYTIVAFGHVNSGVFIVVVVERLAPFLGVIVEEQIFERAPLHLGWDCCAGQFKECRSDIEVGDNVIADRTGCGLFGITHDKGHSQRFFVHESFVIPSVITQEKSLIRCVYYNRILS